MGSVTTIVPVGVLVAISAAIAATAILVCLIIAFAGSITGLSIRAGSGRCLRSALSCTLRGGGIASVCWCRAALPTKLPAAAPWRRRSIVALILALALVLALIIYTLIINARGGGLHQLPVY